MNNRDLPIRILRATISIRATRHVNPSGPAHVPSLETVFVELGDALVFVDVVVDLTVVVDVVVTFVEEDEATFDELEVFTELELDEPEHVPPTGLQPVPQ